MTVLSHLYREGACSQCSALTQVCAAFHVYWVVCSLQDSSSLKHNVYDDGRLYRL